MVSVHWALHSRPLALHGERLQASDGANGRRPRGRPPGSKIGTDGTRIPGVCRGGAVGRVLHVLYPWRVGGSKLMLESSPATSEPTNHPKAAEKHRGNTRG